MENTGFGYSFKTLKEMTNFIKVEYFLESKFLIMMFFALFLFLFTFYIMPFISFRLKGYKEKIEKKERKRKIKYIAMQREIEEEVEREIKRETLKNAENR